MRWMKKRVEKPDVKEREKERERERERKRKREAKVCISKAGGIDSS